MRSRHSPISSYFLALVCMALFASSMASACGHGQRVDTIHASILTVTAARDGFTTWDLDHQHTLVDGSASREDAQAKIAAYRVEQAKVVAGFEVTYRGLALAATQSDDFSLSAALQRVDDLLASIKALKTRFTAPGDSP